MMSEVSDTFVRQLDELIDWYSQLAGRAKYKDISDLGESTVSQYITRARAAVDRISGKGSVYAVQIDAVVERFGSNYSGNCPILDGVLKALREDLSSGYLRTAQELIHAELFADFLAMAEHLLNEGYKDAAAVVAGTALEVHLRQLCEKNSIDVDYTTSRGELVAKKADRLNADLAKEEVYSKLDQKVITAWLDLRNKAAHGRYDEYVAQQVSLLISGVREFITRVPA